MLLRVSSFTLYLLSRFCNCLSDPFFIFLKFFCKLLYQKHPNYRVVLNLTKIKEVQSSFARGVARIYITPSKYRAKLWRWCHHYNTDVIIATLGKNMKNIKYCAISLNMPRTGGLCGVLQFTAPLSFYMSNL